MTKKIKVAYLLDNTNDWIKKYPKLVSRKQKGQSTFYRRRTPNDSKLNINRSLKRLFNQMRIANNQNWPSYFI